MMLDCFASSQRRKMERMVGEDGREVRKDGGKVADTIYSLLLKKKVADATCF